MIKGLYSAASGMVALQDRQDVIANNISNANTPGFRRHNPVQLGFYEVFSKAQRQPGFYDNDSAPGGGVKLVETYPDLAEGAKRQTDNPLDLAVAGPGFMAVGTAGGERYTRNGNLTLDIDGNLSTMDGVKVLGVDGSPIDARGGRVTITGTGDVIVDDVPAGKIKLVEFANPRRLMREGGDLFRADGEIAAQAAPAADTRLEQGMLEMSNVNLPTEIISMTTGLRAYEANQKVMTALDETMGRLIDQVAMPK